MGAASTGVDVAQPAARPPRRRAVAAASSTRSASG